MYNLPSLKIGYFIKRYKRFFIDIFYNNKTITAYNPNTGSMKGLLKYNTPLVFSHSNNPARKLPYTVEGFYLNDKWLYTNTVNINNLVHESIMQGDIKEFKDYCFIQREFTFKKSRFDFLINKGLINSLLEVKNVTLLENNICKFPDAVTKRGKKHLQHLIESITEGYRPYLLFVIQRYCENFQCAEDIDPDFCRMFNDAKKAGVNILFYLNEVDVSKEICKLIKMDFIP